MLLQSNFCSGSSVFRRLPIDGHTFSTEPFLSSRFFVLSALALRLRSKAHRESILVFVQRAIQDLTFNRGARVITGPAVTDLDFNKEMAIFGNNYREIHKIFYFPVARCDFCVLGITEQ